MDSCFSARIRHLWSDGKAKKKDSLSALTPAVSVSLHFPQKIVQAMALQMAKAWKKELRSIRSEGHAQGSVECKRTPCITFSNYTSALGEK